MDGEKIKVIAFKIPRPCPRCGAIPGYLEYQTWKYPDGLLQCIIHCYACWQEWEVPGPDDDD
jgi:hypothetical protein